jgi:hypothetical protein
MADADDLARLCDFVAYRLGPRSQHCVRWRVDELTRLVVQNWPERHLEAIRQHGRRHATVRHTMALVRCRIREVWEVTYGIGPLWPLLLAGTVDQICDVLLDLWYADQAWRDRIAAMRPAAKR